MVRGLQQAIRPPRQPVADVDLRMQPRTPHSQTCSHKESWHVIGQLFEKLGQGCILSAVLHSCEGMNMS